MSLFQRILSRFAPHTGGIIKPQCGDIILNIRMDGCMAEQPTFVWMGEVKQLFFDNGGTECAMVDLIYHHNERHGLALDRAIVPRLRLLKPGFWLELV
mgnify:CR=1 FL=1